MIIQSLLDTDIYKFSMMQTVLHQFPAAGVEYRFKCRSDKVDLRPIRADLEREIEHLCTLRLETDELEYLASLRYMKPDFIEFLRLFHLQSRFIEIAEADGQLSLTIRGPWLHTILFEVPLLAIISEAWSVGEHGPVDEAEGMRRLQAKVDRLDAAVGYQDCRITDFGTRRRYSREWQERLVPRVAALLGPKFAGTSNVDIARRHGLVPQGTMAHEWLQAHQALGPRLRDSQKAAFEAWAQEYRGDLGIALTDVIGLEAFLRDFDLYFCKLFDGMRHDSGDPHEWGERMLEHLETMRIDPRTRTLVFSDGLDIEQVMALYARFRGRCRTSFGIGTNLTNDTGPKALQIVLKMVECNGQPVAKLSDSPGKTMVDDEGYLRYLRQVFEVPQPQAS